ncbi:MAG: DUF2141 domain-containing protein [Cytophagales bacterium]|nr:DUF2141 domain-containing protein [Cytophagales bacterium]
MKKIFFSSAFFMLVHLLCAQSDPVLTVKVSKVKEVKGYMMIAVYDSAEKFLSKELVIGARVAVDDEVITHHFKNLPYGNYAISVYHDVDSDGELATNFMGLPKEPYGFSNGGTNMLGVPSFKRSAFAYNKLKQEINIELK